MIDNHISEISAHIRSAQIVLPCPNLPETLDFFTGRLGFRIEMIVPADSPRTAVVSGHGVTLRLEAESDAPPTPAVLRLLCDSSSMPMETIRGAFSLDGPGGIRVEIVDAQSIVHLPDGSQEFTVSHICANDKWNEGRAGMQYRDLIPGRLGGRFIASHIRIPDGGETPDYVHFHKVRFQMIYCKEGWARVVYEDQGPPFLLQAGDCVLQPPEIRHRVLETSPGLEVIEIACPAIHETHVDHDLPLPTSRILPRRLYDNQRFVFHRVSEARWTPWILDGFEARDTGIAAATNGLAAARVVRRAAVPAMVNTTSNGSAIQHAGEFFFLFVLRGELILDNIEYGGQLQEGDSCVLPADLKYTLRASAGLEMLEVRLPAE
jgi:mannose-6-phosphate isomerase-like protein (cupin superfamily)